MSSICWRANEEISCMECYTSRYLETFLVGCFVYFCVSACTPAMGIGQDLALLSTKSYKITQAGTMNHGHWSVIAVISSTFHWVVVVYWRCKNEGFAQEKFCLGEIPGGFIPSPCEWLFATSTQWLEHGNICTQCIRQWVLSLKICIINTWVWCSIWLAWSISFVHTS